MKPASFAVLLVILVSMIALVAAFFSSPTVASDDPTLTSMKSACLDVLNQRATHPGTVEVISWTKLERRPASQFELLGPVPSEAALGANYSIAIWEYNVRKKRYSGASAELLTIFLSFTSDVGGFEMQHPAVSCTYVAIGGAEAVIVDPAQAEVDGRTAYEFDHSGLPKTF